MIVSRFRDARLLVNTQVSIHSRYGQSDYDQSVLSARSPRHGTKPTTHRACM